MLAPINKQDEDKRGGVKDPGGTTGLDCDEGRVVTTRLARSLPLPSQPHLLASRKSSTSASTR